MPLLLVVYVVVVLMEKKEGPKKVPCHSLGSDDISRAMMFASAMATRGTQQIDHALGRFFLFGAFNARFSIVFTLLTSSSTQNALDTFKTTTAELPLLWQRRCQQLCQANNSGQSWNAPRRPFATSGQREREREREQKQKWKGTKT